MAYPEYCLTLHPAVAEVRENKQWPYTVSTLLPSKQALEDEIDDLRHQMERLVIEENSFTSESVVELSSLLDLKINEYMKLQQKSR